MNGTDPIYDEFKQPLAADQAADQAADPIYAEFKGTALSPGDEQAYQKWVKDFNVPVNSLPDARAYWQQNRSRFPAAYSGDSAGASAPSAAARYGGSLWESTVGGLVDAIKRYGPETYQKAAAAAQKRDWGEAIKESLFATAPGLNIATDIAKGSIQQGTQAYQQTKAGQYGQAALSATGAVPFVGPMVQKPIEQFVQGDVAGGLGTLTGEAATLGLPKLIPRGAAVPVVPAFSKTLAPAEQAAVTLGETYGVPMTAATRTGSPIVTSAQKLAQYVPFSGAKQALAAQETGLVRAGEQLAEKATGGTVPTTAELAGQAVQKELTTRGQQLAQDARAAYDDLARLENDPRNIRTIQTGTKTTTSPMLNAQGQPISVSQPVTQQMGLPVDMRSAKTALQPLYDALKQEMPVAQQQASKGLQAIENIINGPDYSPASVADQNLSAMKAIQREGVSAKSRYLASKAIDQFSPAIDQAVAQAGPQATQALQDARSLWKAKTATQETLENLNTEPVKLFNQLTTRKDAAINLLRDVQSKAPDALPQVGRAYLDGLLEKAFGEAGTGKPGAVLTEWNNLGPSTKEILFKDPPLRADLDSFFTLAKKAAENPNPSGTAPVAQVAADGSLIIATHGGAIPWLIGRSALARILMSQSGARILANGFRVSVRNPAAATLAANQILRVAGDAAVPADRPLPSR